MSLHNKIPSEEVEEKNRKNKSVMKGCPSLDLNQSLGETDLQLNHILNSTDAIKLNRPRASKPQNGKHVVGEEEPEYGCNFCPKKFSNKQALGGHQNAHKIEKVGLKRTRQGQIANFGYTGNGFTLPNSFDQVPKWMKGPQYPQYMEHQVQAHEYPCSMFPMSHESGVVQPVMGFGGFCTSPKHPPKPQMDYPGSMFPMSHESGVLQPFMGISSFGTNPGNPPFMSFERRMGQGARTSKGRSTTVAKNDEAGDSKQINDTEIQHQEDDLDLSLKL